MANLAFNTPIQRHILGDLVMEVYVVSGAAGGTLQTPQMNILFIGVQPGSVITGVAQAGYVTNGQVNGTILTVSSSANMNNESVMIISRKG